MDNDKDLKPLVDHLAQLEMSLVGDLRWSSDNIVDRVRAKRDQARLELDQAWERRRVEDKQPTPTRRGESDRVTITISSGCHGSSREEVGRALRRLIRESERRGGR